jgi:hypothetical protein
MQIKDEKRDDDREESVAEPLDAIGACIGL